MVVDDAELAVELVHHASALSMDVEPILSDRPMVALRQATVPVLGMLLSKTPDVAALTDAATYCEEKNLSLVLALLGAEPSVERVFGLASDLGIAAVGETRALLAALRMLAASPARPWLANVRALGTATRARFERAGWVSEKGGRIVQLDAGLIGWADGADEIVLGEPRDVAAAGVALQRASHREPLTRAVVDGVDRPAVENVLFGPPRLLSDPASKAALRPYGLPLPLEELCTSPSRAAGEASRLGYPVKVSLASPDLRLWDHPDLIVRDAENAAAVKEAFRQLTTLALDRNPDARVLGVHVTAEMPATALFSVVARPASEGVVVAEIGFADPHGAASGDTTYIALPLSPAALERAFERLRGASLVLGGRAADRRTVLEGLADALTRVAAFVDAHRHAVRRLEARPLAVLVGGGTELREIAIEVSDHFTRTLDG